MCAESLRYLSWVHNAIDWISVKEYDIFSLVVFDRYIMSGFMSWVVWHHKQGIILPV
jgi:hypothetical protein